MSTRITQAQADDAAAQAASFWPEFGQRWPWTRAPEFAPVYQRAGDLTVSLLRAFPAIQWSNQARWYQRTVRDTPAVIALSPEALRAEVGNVSPGASQQSLEGKHALSLIYLPDQAPDAHTPIHADPSSEPPIAKTLLASTATAAPYYSAQLAHELLNCFCHTDWDGHTIRSGVRRTEHASPQNDRGGALNDLLLDAMLVHFLPGIEAIALDELVEGAQGPYWRIAQALSLRLRGVPALSALFSGAPDAIRRFEQGLTLALDTADAAHELDTLAAAHDWAGLGRLLGEEN